MVVGPGNLANYKGKTRGRIYSARNELLYKDKVRMRIILLGPPGSGKSAISRKIADKYGLPVVSVEEVAEELSAMAQQEDELGRLARDSIGSGRVSDDVCNIVIRRVLGKDELDPGFVLVGYPKDAAQAEFMEQSLNQMNRPLDLVLMIDIDRDELMERRVGRIDCDACGTHYNLYVNPPLVEGVCDMCGSRVSRRPRGYEENISNQLREYDVAVQPVLDFYRGLDKLRLVDANGTEEELWEGVQQVIDNTTPVVLEPPVGDIEQQKTGEMPGESAAEKKAAGNAGGRKAESASSAKEKKTVKKASAGKAASSKKKTAAKATENAEKKTTAGGGSSRKVAKKTATAKKVVKKAAAKKAAAKKAVKKATTKPAAKKVAKKAAKKKVVKKATKKATKKVAKKAAAKKVAKKAAPGSVAKKVVKKAAKKKVAKKPAKKVAKKKPVSKKKVARKKAAGRTAVRKKTARKTAARKVVKKAPVRKKAVKKKASAVKAAKKKIARKKATGKKR